MPYNNKTNAEYKNNYEREKYDRIIILAEKGNKDKFKAYAANAGLSVNAWINKAIQEKIERDEKTAGENREAGKSPGTIQA